LAIFGQEKGAKTTDSDLRLITDLERIAKATDLEDWRSRVEYLPLK
jgi:hypothetical protein